ncbi:MAG: hypothetical protein Q8Q11_03090 [bacterium]|nr:hypothetical protein [bacterium]MDZ4248413.1 hypothetical protein [Patescibacteria group bacterium]
MPTVEKKYTTDIYEGRKDFQGSHDVYEMPEKNKPQGTRSVHVSPRTVVTILLLLLFIGAVITVIIEIMKRSQGFV